jgi:hypothetical protein
VTLGAKSFQKDEHGRYVKGALRHPIVEAFQRWLVATSL